MIKAYLRGQQHDWDQNLGCLAAAYRATPHETTGMSPNLLMLGREVRLPAEIMFSTGKSEISEEFNSYGDYVSHLHNCMLNAHNVARTYLQKAAKRQGEMYDAKTQQTKYEKGDMVWVRSDITQLHITPKLRCPYEGPYLIVQKLNELDYLIQLDEYGKCKVVHHNRLEPYRGEQLAREASKSKRN
jgi:hypothetical protein